MTTEELYRDLLALVEKSEARIDRTNEMVNALVRTCERNIEVYNSQVITLEQSRESAQENAAKSIEVSKNLTEMLANLRTDYQRQLDALKGELHSLTNEYKQEMVEMRKDYKELSASYRRLAESHSGSRTDVSINSRNKND